MSIFDLVSVKPVIHQERFILMMMNVEVRYWTFMSMTLILLIIVLACQWRFFSQGYKGPSGGIDHVATHYIYDQSQNAPLVTAEGTWTMQEGYGFNMSYTANFEKATACYLLDKEETLTLFRSGYEPETIKLDEGMGYEFEIRSFVDDILNNKTININLLKQAAESVAIIEAEQVSIKSCFSCYFKYLITNKKL